MNKLKKRRSNSSASKFQTQPKGRTPKESHLQFEAGEEEAQISKLKIICTSIHSAWTQKSFYPTLDTSFDPFSRPTILKAVTIYGEREREEERCVFTNKKEAIYRSADAAWFLCMRIRAPHDMFAPAAAAASLFMLLLFSSDSWPSHRFLHSFCATMPWLETNQINWMRWGWSKIISNVCIWWGETTNIQKQPNNLANKPEGCFHCEKTQKYTKPTV